ncbi:hypothetical protein Pla110_17070 [Polystyrenella longa]|uniref:Lipoprotein n=1 Tax=Polystyrenella longa TaxID=2528007 RepID=A0A518CL81_9PLAN|nr:hypothetical protein [Polystyrenella longa]QDU79985.1 hypothetical protein Pla110_17070 [Polystyrenella longa]
MALRFFLIPVRATSLVMVSAFLLTLLGGCQAPEQEYIEVKRVHEQLTPTEIRDYLKIVYSLPTPKVPELAPAYAPPADWERTRTLSVHDLVLEEEKYIDQLWNEEVLVRQLMRNKPLMKRLKRAHMTPQQFVGFTYTIGMSLSRATIRDNQDLRQILEEGGRAMHRLKEDKRSFSVLSEENEEDMHIVLRNAMWITRVNRVENLMKVPPENVSLVRQYAKQLTPIFPDDFKQNPLDKVQDLLVEFGLPFEETELVGTDVDMSWEKSEARVGFDEPGADGNSRELQTELLRVKDVLQKH